VNTASTDPTQRWNTTVPWSSVPTQVIRLPDTLTLYDCPTAKSVAETVNVSPTTRHFVWA